MADSSVDGSDDEMGYFERNPGVAARWLATGDEEQGTGDESSRFEDQPRQSSEWNDANREGSRLPIKQLDGTVRRPSTKYIPATVTAPKPHADEHSDEEAARASGGESSGAESEPEPQQETAQAIFALSPAELRQRRTRRKLEIAELCEMIISYPEKSVRKSSGNKEDRLLTLYRICHDADPTVAKYAIMSSVAVFKDILPGYRIRMPTDQERDIKLKKDVKRLWDYERGILTGYQRFLKYLEGTVGQASSVFDRVLVARQSATQFTRDLSAADADAADEVLNTSERNLYSRAVVCVRAQCELLKAKLDFNFRSNLLGCIVSRLMHPNREVAVTCLATTKHVFQVDETGEVVLEAVKAIAKLVKRAPGSVNGEVIRLLQALKLHGALRDVNTSGDKKKKKKRKYGAKAKQEQELERSLAMADAEAKVDKTKSFKAVLSDLMAIYFRLLKQNQNPDALGAVLDGLGQFSHLIDPDVVAELVALLRGVAGRDNLALRAGLSCIRAALKILQGPGKLLNIPVTEFGSYLYAHLLRLMPPHVHSRDDAGMAMECVELYLLKQREFEAEKAAAFIKRCLFLAVHAPVHETLGWLQLSRMVLQSYPPARCVLDTEADRANTGKRHTTDGRELSGAAGFSATCWELNVLRIHYHPTVRQMAYECAHGIPVMRVAASEQIIASYDPSNGAFTPAVVLPTKHPVRKWLAGEPADGAGGRAKRQKKQHKTAEEAGEDGGAANETGQLPLVGPYFAAAPDRVMIQPARLGWADVDGGQRVPDVFGDSSEMREGFERKLKADVSSNIQLKLMTQLARMQQIQSMHHRWKQAQGKTAKKSASTKATKGKHGKQ